MKYCSLILVCCTLSFGYSIYAQQNLFWSDAVNQVVEKSSIQGEDIVPLVSQDLQTPYSIAIDTVNQKIYWSDSGLDKIQRSNLNGSNIEDIITTNLVEPRGIAIDLINSKLYWVDFGTSQIERSDLDGSNREPIITTLVEEPHGITLDLQNNHLYWTDRKAGKIQRSNLGGGATVDILVGLSNPAGIELDLINNKLYWTDSKADNIGMANLDGSSSQIIVSSDIDTPFRVRVNHTEGKIYWTDFTLKHIKKADLDGSNVETVLDETDGLSGPSGLAIIGQTVLANTEPIKTRLKIFPNPATHQITFGNLESLNHLREVEILTISGKLIYRTQLDQGDNSLDISHLSPGTYLLRVLMRENISSVKFIKMPIKP